MKMIVHDLKTPLTTVRATIEMLHDGDFGSVNNDQRKALSDAQNKAEDLLTLIDDLLALSRIEEAALPIEVEPIAPAELLSELMAEWRLRLEQEGATATVDVAADTPSLEADRTLVKRVFGNLIQNALMHSASAVTLHISARHEDDGVLFTVADTGPGIPPEYHEVIFQKFQQVKTPHAPRVASSGLGLAFCRMAVEAHGGRIWVQSAGGQGSAFHFVLPLSPRRAPAPAGASATAAAALAAGS
jgi:signal transduction histidine kinase